MISLTLKLLSAAGLHRHKVIAFATPEEILGKSHRHRKIIRVDCP